MSGGLGVLYPDGVRDESKLAAECFVRGIRCSAREARMGGIVIQPVDA
jgi:hypothetical protein